jgi:membrane-bound lytic murein transglycosylase A
MLSLRSVAVGLIALVATACAARETPPPATPATALTRPAEPAKPVPTARLSPLAVLGGPEAIPGWTAAEAAAITAPFLRGCPALIRRADGSGLTQPEDWRVACDAVRAAPDPAAAFSAQFRAVRVGTGVGLNTGYFEPLLEGSLTRTERYTVPIYRRPADLVEVDLGTFRDSLKGQRIAGRVEAGRRLVPYADRAAIDDGALAGRNLELLWVADAYEAFFLHIQGSGKVRLPDGRIIQVGFDGQNGHPYTGIGRLLLDRGELPRGSATMDGMIAWGRLNPDKMRAVMRENRSYIFFRIVEGEGPLGSLNVALTPERSIAVDPLFVPLGAPVWLEGRHPNAADVRTTLPFARAMVAQDTGGAIRGPNRVDVFWGEGAAARAIAGAMAQQNSLTVLLPVASVDRLRADGLIAP